MKFLLLCKILIL